MKSSVIFLKNYASKLKCKNLLLFCLSIYRCVFSIHFGGACRFYPSCSHYAEQALRRYPLRKSLLLIIKRLSKCHFLGQSFILDPVPSYCENDFQMDLTRQKNVFMLGIIRSKQKILQMDGSHAEK